MKAPKNETNDFTIDSKHYSLFANMRTVPWIASTTIFTIIRASIVIYTMLFMAIVLTPPNYRQMVQLEPFYPLLYVLYYFLFPLSTILTSISGVDALYIFHLLLLSIDAGYFSVIYNEEINQRGFIQTYSILSIAMAVVNFLFFFYWSIPNRLLFINAFQIGVKLKTKTPYNIVKRIGLIWVLSFLVLVVAASVIPIWVTYYPEQSVKRFLYQESLLYLFAAAILIIEYFMYKQTHAMYKYEFKDLIQIQCISSVIYISIIIFFISYFFVLLICGMTGLASDWFLKHKEEIELIHLITEAIFWLRFFFLWNISMEDISKDLSIINVKSEYPHWSWDWIQIKSTSTKDTRDMMISTIQ